MYWGARGTYNQLNPQTCQVAQRSAPAWLHSSPAVKRVPCTIGRARHIVRTAAGAGRGCGEVFGRPAIMVLLLSRTDKPGLIRSVARGLSLSTKLECTTMQFPETQSG